MNSGNESRSRQYYHAHREELLIKKALKQPHLQYYDNHCEKEKARARMNYQKKVALKRKDEQCLIASPADGT